MSYRPCSCKNWGNCKGYEIYYLNEIIPCKAQIIWLIKGDIEFDTDDSQGSRRVRPHASFVALSDLVAEFELRLGRTGRDGETLCHEIRNLNVYEYRNLSQAAKDAVNYISGIKRKRYLYSRWLAQRVRRQNEARILQIK